MIRSNPLPTLPLAARLARLVALGVAIASPFGLPPDAQAKDAQAPQPYWTQSRTTSGSDFGYALFEGESRTSSNMQVLDWDRVAREVERSGRPQLWVSVAGTDYVIEDERLVERAIEILAPMRELGKQQGRLGRQQGKLGREQGRLGALQGRLGAQQARLTARLVRMSVRGGATKSEREAIEEEIRGLGEEQERLAEEQRPLGQKQEELGRQQEELGRRQERASKSATEELRRLADQAIERGRAERVR